MRWFLLLIGGLIVASSLTGRQSASGSQVPIKIGLVCGCTGPLAAAVVDVPAIYKAWVESVNAAGGINGHHIDLIYKNDDKEKREVKNTFSHQAPIPRQASGCQSLGYIS